MRRYKHSLSHYRLVTHDMGQLIPVAKMEVLPGDSFQQRTSALIRVTPLVAPVMHPVDIRIHHFFVPMRKLMNNDGDWEKFITGGKDGLGEGVTLPTLTSPPTTGYLANSLPDYLGIPPGVPDVTHLAMPIRAFNMIYNEYYRDQDLVEEVPVDDLKIPQIAWGKDYFTAARPWPQKGPDVTLPIGDSAPVVGDTTVPVVVDQATQLNAGGFEADGGAASNIRANGPPGGLPNGAVLWQNTGMRVDLTQAEAVNINEFRKAFALQRYQEARARYGSRFVDYLAYLGVRSSDARLQRPEFLGGGRATISFSEVLNTTSSVDGATPVDDLGHMAGHGIAALRSNKYRKFFEEHGYIISLLSVRPRNMYMNALNRSWTRQTKEDFFQKELEQIGQQEIKTQEIYAAEPPATVFGYQDRYSEYKTHPSTIHGEFRDQFDYWHFGRDFATPPVLNQSFTDCVPTKRVFAEQTQHSLWTMVNNSVQARRMVNTSGKSRIM